MEFKVRICSLTILVQRVLVSFVKESNCIRLAQWCYYVGFLKTNLWRRRALTTDK